MMFNNPTNVDVDMTDIFSQLFSTMSANKPPKSTKSSKFFEGLDDVMFMQFPPHPMMSQNITQPIIEPLEDIHHNHEITFIQAYEGICAPIKITRQITIGNQNYEEIETFYVNISKGIDHNEIITLVSKGNIRDKQQSDVKVHIILKQDFLFERQGMDLIIHHHISFKESLLGFSFVNNLRAFLSTFR